MHEYEEFDDEIYEKMKMRIRSETDRKIFQQVFDSKTFEAMQALANKGSIDVLEHIISTGKEAHVFIASDVSGNKRAVKIFKKETTHFKKMNQYIDGDPRFRNLATDRRGLVLAWARKEYKNLVAASNAHLAVPLPIAIRENTIVMEFIGEGENAAPRLKDIVPAEKDLIEFRKQTVQFLSGLYLAGLVHADLSEYNILVKGKELTMIDFAQAQNQNHPRAKEFFERDVANMASYFSKAGLETSYGELYAMVKKEKERSAKVPRLRKT